MHHFHISDNLVRNLIFFVTWSVAAAGFLVKTGKNALDAGTNLVPVRAYDLDHEGHRDSFHAITSDL